MVTKNTKYAQGAQRIHSIPMAVHSYLPEWPWNRKKNDQQSEKIKNQCSPVL
jgi:hypothetical protein